MALGKIAPSSSPGLDDTDDAAFAQPGGLIAREVQARRALGAITAPGLPCAAHQLGAAYPDASGYRTPEPQPRRVPQGPPPLRRVPPATVLPSLGRLLPRVLHFGAAPCTAGGDCPLHGHGGHAATSTLALAHSPAVLSSPHATTGTAWLPSSASSSPLASRVRAPLELWGAARPAGSSGAETSSGSAGAPPAARAGRRRRRRASTGVACAAAEAEALRVRCGELEARLLALGAPLPPAPGCAAGAGARSGSDSDAHSSERLPLPAGKRARSGGAAPGAAAAAAAARLGA